MVSQALIDGNNTKVVDKIKFELPFGLVGKILEFYFESKLQRIFEHRVYATKKFLEHPIHQHSNFCFFIKKNEILSANKESINIVPKIRSYASAVGKY